MKPRAFITGITGQDGSYLAEALLAQDYEVHGLIRRSATDNTHNILHLLGTIELHVGDMTDGATLSRIVASVKPRLVFNLAAQSDVALSWKCPAYTFDVNATGVARLLDACVQMCSSTSSPVNFYQASTSEMFGFAGFGQRECDEDTPLQPRSPYAASKVAAHYLCKAYRDVTPNLEVGIGILFNHESPRRGARFVTQHIVRSAVAIAMGKATHITLGNIWSVRDWGFARDYVDIMLRICMEGGVYVVGTGVGQTVKWFAEETLRQLNLSPFLVKGDSHYRPNDITYLVADPTAVAARFLWKAETTQEQLIHIMLDAEARRNNTTLDELRNRNHAA